MHIAASNPLALNSDEIDKEILLKEQKPISEELKNSGKPNDIVEKISVGKINKFKEENSLMSQDWVMEPKKVKEILDNLKNSKIEIIDFIRIKLRIMFSDNSYKLKMSKTIDIFEKELGSLRTEEQMQICSI